MFQIALAYAMSRKFQGRLLFLKHENHVCGQGSYPSKYYTNLYEKLVFVDKLEPTVTITEKQWTAYSLLEEVQLYLDNRQDTLSVVLFYGNWQSLQNFQDYRADIKTLFTPSVGIISYLEQYTRLFDRFPELKDEHDYCFIGVRRGDYIQKAYEHNPCGMTFYNEGMRQMNKQRYYIASDDTEWCRKNFVGTQYVFFDINDDLEQLFSAALFKNYILSNSSFHWWGSYLSIYPDPTILIADKWIFGKDVKREQYYSIYRPEMRIIERPVETE
jgi:hypothetical protein